ncbi:hypothetical protein ME1_00460 [Bartonella vinsonii subsp. arupensis OK-94-513]|uniref:Uncharacterized protein n=2 Tax=Bartonella vinsonii subsp. arupensis TaxID=110578 RepID=J1JYC8_BARVI|nr:hypothetical protein ME1_00460 [Bartonella vinsonii subsp. arupensis OK-94-513]EJF98341.1 hypothetical protein MEI_00840 [Bartonella vinsonii subsp. arupensis Pm136co]
MLSYDKLDYKEGKNGGSGKHTMCEAFCFNVSTYGVLMKCL